MGSPMSERLLDTSALHTASVCVCVCACVLGGGRLAVVLHPGDGGFAEETVLVVHQVLVDTGSTRGETT